MPWFLYIIFPLFHVDPHGQIVIPTIKLHGQSDGGPHEYLVCYTPKTAGKFLIQLTLTNGVCKGGTGISMFQFQMGSTPKLQSNEGPL